MSEFQFFIVVNCDNSQSVPTWNGLIFSHGWKYCNKLLTDMHPSKSLSVGVGGWGELLTEQQSSDPVWISNGSIPPFLQFQIVKWFLSFKRLHPNRQFQKLDFFNSPTPAHNFTCLNILSFGSSTPVHDLHFCFWPNSADVFVQKFFSLCLISWQKSSCDKICRAAIGANPLRANKGAIWPKLPNTTSYCSKQSRQRVQCEVYFKLKPSNFLSACRGCKYSSILRTDASKSVWREF